MYNCGGMGGGVSCADCLYLSQNHKYVVQAEVLTSWPLDEAELTFIQKLRESRRNGMRGSVKNTTPQSLPSTPKVPLKHVESTVKCNRLILILMD